MEVHLRLHVSYHNLQRHPTRVARFSGTLIVISVNVFDSSRMWTFRRRTLFARTRTWARVTNLVDRENYTPRKIPDNMIMRAHTKLLSNAPTRRCLRWRSPSTSKKKNRKKRWVITHIYLKVVASQYVGCCINVGKCLCCLLYNVEDQSFATFRFTIYLSIHPSTYLSIYLSIFLPTCLSICSSIHPSIHLL